jgi:hypothetical protein
VQARDLLVEVLRQHVDFFSYSSVVGEQLDLRQRLVGERGRHHEARVAGGVAEVHQAAFGQQDDALAVGEFDSSTCGLMLVHFRLLQPRLSISLSKWPMLQTMALSFIARMCSMVMMSLLPVAVTKMSALSARLPWSRPRSLPSPPAARRSDRSR